MWIVGHTSADDKVVVLTDSLSLVSKMESHKIMKEWQNLLNAIEAEVTICYIPAHSGVTWNEETDRLAGLAVPLGMLQHTPSDIVAEIKHRVIQIEREEQDEICSVVRLKERGYKYGGGASVSARGRERAIINQTELGVITKSTLRRLLEGEGPMQKLEPYPLYCDVVTR